MEIDLITNVRFNGISWTDYPDFLDMYIESADYDGIPMDGDQLDELNKDTQMVHNLYTRKNE